MTKNTHTYTTMLYIEALYEYTVKVCCFSSLLVFEKYSPLGVFSSVSCAHAVRLMCGQLVLKSGKMCLCQQVFFKQLTCRLATI